jgi:hypothetical protein
MPQIEIKIDCLRQQLTEVLCTESMQTFAAKLQIDRLQLLELPERVSNLTLNGNDIEGVRTCDILRSSNVFGSTRRHAANELPLLSFVRAVELVAIRALSLPAR